MENVTEFWTEIDRVERRRRARWGLGVLVATLAVSGTAACSSPEAEADTAADAPVATTVAPSDPTAPTDPGTPVTVNETPGQTGSPQPTNPPAPPTTEAPSGPAPTIDSFVTPENIDCHNGDFQEFTASWSTTGAERVTIAIDGPGTYAEYGPDGETSLPFNCSSSHTFTLVAHGADGQTDSRSITLLPRNVQTDDAPEATDDLAGRLSPDERRHPPPSCAG